MSDPIAADSALQIGDWEVRPLEGLIRGPSGEQRLRPKSMDVLMRLAASPGELVTRDQLIEDVWGRALISDEPLTACIAELRRTLGDRRDRPSYIQTVPKRGYRLVAAVSSPQKETPAGAETPISAPPSRKPVPRYALAAAALVVMLAAVMTWLWYPADSGREIAAPEAGATGNAIAVLPFENLSADPENAFLGDGIAEEILNSLTSLEGLRVTSRTSSFALAQQELDIRELAARLNVTHVLEGSVRRAGDRLRITAQLVEVASDSHLWSEVYDEPATDIFRIQREIATRVADQLKLRFSLTGGRSAADVGTSNPEAYDWYLRGRDQLARRTTQSLEKAIESFRLAHDFDTRFARAYVGLADAYLLMRDYNDRPSEGYLRKALRAADAAIRLDPELGEAWTTLGAIHHEGLDFEAAEQAFAQALELAPRHPKTLHWYGYFLYDTARQNEADKLFREALSRDPLSSILTYAVGTNLIAMGKFDEAEAEFRAIMEMDPEFAWAYEGMAELSWRGRGRLDEAIDWYRRAVAYDPSSADRRALLGQIHLDVGKPEDAADYMDAALALRQDSVFVQAHLALLQLYQGQSEAANETARAALELDASNTLALYVARNHALATSRADEAKQLYAAGFPRLLEPDPLVDRSNFQAAVDLALVLMETGERDQAERLLTRAEPIARAFPRSGLPYALSDVKILALRGDSDAAVEQLNASIDAGWRAYWWVFLEHDPTLAVLREDPAFAAAVARLRASLGITGSSNASETPADH